MRKPKAQKIPQRPIDLRPSRAIAMRSLRAAPVRSQPSDRRTLTSLAERLSEATCGRWTTLGAERDMLRLMISLAHRIELLAIRLMVRGIDP